MQFGLNTINPINSMGNMGSPLQSPYAHGLAQKQFTLQNQQQANYIEKGQQANSNNKGSQKEIQLIQAYQQHTQKLKEQA